MIKLAYLQGVKLAFTLRDMQVVGAPIAGSIGASSAGEGNRLHGAGAAIGVGALTPMALLHGGSALSKRFPSLGNKLMNQGSLLSALLAPTLGAYGAGKLMKNYRSEG